MPSFTVPAVLINHSVFSNHLIPCNSSPDHTIPLPFMISANSTSVLSLITCVFIRLWNHISPLFLLLFSLMFSEGFLLSPTHLLLCLGLSDRPRRATLDHESRLSASFSSKSGYRSWPHNYSLILAIHGPSYADSKMKRPQLSNYL